jgi:branched-subunit amino acid permease
MNIQASKIGLLAFSTVSRICSAARYSAWYAILICTVSSSQTRLLYLIGKHLIPTTLHNMIELLFLVIEPSAGTVNLHFQEFEEVLIDRRC